MFERLDGFTAYIEPNDNLGLVEVYSNMRDLEISPDTNRSNFRAEITFLEASAHGLTSVNPCLVFGL